MQLKKKANETELKTLQETKLGELEQEQKRFQQQCMEVRKYCDEQELLIKKLNFKQDILLQDQDFLEFELQNSRRENADLKVQLSKNLTILEKQ